MTALLVRGRRARRSGGEPDSLIARLGLIATVAGIILTCFSGRWGDLGAPVPIDRLLLPVGLGLSLVAFLRSGGRFSARPVFVFMALAVLWAGLSVVSVNGDLENGLFTLWDRFGVMPYLLFALAPTVFRTEASRRLLARAFVVFGIYLGITAVAQILGFDQLVWPRYILDPSVGAHSDRARGPYVESVANGLMLAFCAALAGVAVATERSRLWRALGLVAIGLGIIGVALTLTRSIWLGAAVAAFAALAVIPPLRKRALAAGVAVAAAGGIAFLTIPQLMALVSERASEQGPVWDRLNTNDAAWRMLLEYPLTGVGWEQASQRMAEFVRQGADYPVTAASVGLEPHNIFLMRFAEMGLIGGSLWLAVLLAGPVFALFRRPGQSDLQPWRAALLPMLIVWVAAAMLSPMAYTQPNYLLWLTGGLVLAPYLTRDRVEGPVLT